MKNRRQLSGALPAAAALVAVLAAPTLATGQTQGYNAICGSTNGTCTTSELTGSSAFIDASAYGSTTANFCGVIHTILTNTHLSPPFVIDARGLPGTTGTSMNCSSSPWAGINNPPGSVILLPAGTITTSASWVLPANTKLIGTAKGNGPLGSNYAFETMIQASANFSGAVVQFGDPSHCSSGCQGISVEHLTISGNGSAGYTMNGIENDFCGQQCYVEHVTLYQVLGTGLKLSGSYATDSGPYSNITFDLAGITPQTSTACAKIIGASGTRGIHGITCIANPTTAFALSL